MVHNYFLLLFFNTYIYFVYVLHLNNAVLKNCILQIQFVNKIYVLFIIIVYDIEETYSKVNDSFKR